MDSDKLLLAIKKDDIKLFDELNAETPCGNFRFGRFPLLSLLYLYNARTIIRKYATKFAKIYNYEELTENAEIYLLFKKKAGKCLRLYLNDMIVSPLEMLMILDKTATLRKLYPSIQITPTIKNNLSQIYAIKYDLSVEFNGNDIIMERRPLTKREKTHIIYAAISALLCVAICISTPFIVNAFIPKPGDAPIIDSGNDTPDTDISDPTPTPGGNSSIDPSPSNKIIEVSSSSEIDFSQNNSYKLTADVTLSSAQLSGISENKCTILGNNHTITTDVPFGTPLFSTISGTLFDFSIEYTNISTTINKAFAVITDVNNGLINNVSVKLDGTINTAETEQTSSPNVDKSNETYYYQSLLLKNYTSFAAIAYVNYGQIKDCAVTASLNLKGDLSANSAFSSIAVINEGIISNCSLNGTVTSDTVDLCGITNINKNTVYSCSNNATLTQTSALEGWSPYVCGIAHTNLSPNNFFQAVINNCTNTADLSATSTLGEDMVDVTVSGIAQINYGGMLVSCTNSGKLAANGEFATTYISGITIFNYNYYNNGVISQCTNGAATSSTITKGNTYAGGICVINYGYAQKSTNNGSATCQISSPNSEETSLVGCYVGGIVAINLGYATGNISTAELNISNTANAVYVGGICGSNNYLTSYNKSTAAINVNVSTTAYVGGITGINKILQSSNGTITTDTETDYCISSSSIKVINTSPDNYAFIGGIVGYNESYIIDETGYSTAVQYNFTINNTYEIDCTNKGIGGIVGGCGIYGYQNNVRVYNNKNYYYYLNNYYTEHAAVSVGIGLLAKETTPVEYEAGGNLFTEKTTFNAIKNKEEYNKILTALNN